MNEAVGEPHGSAPEGRHLERGSVPLTGVVAQSVGNMGISGVVALVVPLVAVTAGSGSWLTWIVCSIVIALVAWTIAMLARRFATSGGIYGLAAKGLGSFGGVLTGWTMLILVGLLSGSTVIGFGIYASQFLAVAHIPTNHVTMAVMYCVGLAVAWMATFSGMKRSSTAMLGIELVTIVSIFVLMVAVLVTHHGSIVDSRQLTLRGSSFHMVLLGVVLAVLSFGGFESATVLGQEARNPRRAIPVAMFVTVLLGGVFWLFSGYVLYLGFQGTHYDLATSSAPLKDLAQIAGIAPYRYVVDLTIALTLLGTLIAVFNGVTRFMFTMARDGIAPSSWAKTHPKHCTPATAVHWLGVTWVATIAVVVVANFKPFDVIEELGDVSGYAFMVMYILIAISAVVFLRKQRELRPSDALAGVLAVCALGYVFYENVVPFPQFPDDIVLYCFLGTMVAIVGTYAVVRQRSPRLLASVGSSVDEDTALDCAP